MQEDQDSASAEEYVAPDTPPKAKKGVERKLTKQASVQYENEGYADDYFYDIDK